MKFTKMIEKFTNEFKERILLLNHPDVSGQRRKKEGGRISSSLD